MTRARDLADLLTGGQTIETDDNTVQLTLKSTDADANVGPILDVIRDSASPADGDEIGRFRFKGDDDAGNETTYAFMQVKINDATDASDDGELEILTRTNGNNRSRIELLPTETVFNEDSQDIDFRVESDGNANMLVVDAGNDKVGVGTNTPAARFSALSTSGTTTDIGRFEAAVGSYTGTSLVAGNTLGAANSYNLFKCITDSDADAGGPVTQFLVRGDGNVGIGTSSPSRKLELNNGATGSFVTFTDGVATNFTFKTDGSNVGTFGTEAGSTHLAFMASGTEQMRISTGGNIRFFQTGSDSPGLGNTTTGHAFQNGGIVTFSSASGYVSVNRNGDGTRIQFNNSGNTRGSITVTGTTTAYNTSSDRRLKSNIQDAASASSKIDAMKVRQFDWNETGEHQEYGLIAQELQPIEPLAVSGSEDSNKMMGVDYSILVPMLIKEIQELRSRVAALEAS